MTEIGQPSGAGPPTDEPLAADVTGPRWLRRHAAGGVAVITTVAQAEYLAATATAYLVASLDPFQMLVSLEAETPMVEALDEGGVFGISLLPWRLQVFADQFAGFTPRASRTFVGIDHFTAATGSPILSACIAWADCRVASTFTTGDHRCYVADVLAVGQGSGDPDDPLLFYRRRYRRLR
jgi:flavin reductase (DIM6/NTAB) family NADH-FMN oxidoreductase RutF